MERLDDCHQTCTWCDLKGSPSGSGVCLSDPIADAISQIWADGVLDCTEPDELLDEEGDYESESDSEEEEEGEEGEETAEEQEEGGEGAVDEEIKL